MLSCKDYIATPCGEGCFEITMFAAGFLENEIRSVIINDHVLNLLYIKNILKRLI